MLYEFQTDLNTPVALYSSGGRALHRYRKGHGFDSRSMPDIFQARVSYGCVRFLYIYSFSTRNSMSMYLDIYKYKLSLHNLAVTTE